MVDASKSFEVSDDGISMDDGVHLSSGAAVPTHTAPQGSFYWREGTIEVYQNTDGATNWVLFEPGGDDEPASYAAAKADHVSSPVNYDLAADTWTKFTDFNGELESTVANVDLPNDKIVIPTDGNGVYVVTFTLNATFNAAGKFYGSIYLNNVIQNLSIVHGDFSNGDNDFISGTCMMTLADSDELEFYIKSTNINQDPDIESVLFAIHKVSGGSKGDTGATGPTGATGATGPQGPAGVVGTWLGTWASGTAYSVDDIVEFSGSSYLCITATAAGESPDTHPAKWDLVAQKGDQGSSGGNLDITIHPHNGPYKTYASTTYFGQAEFIFKGTSAIGTPTAIKSVSWMDTGGVSYSCRVYDLTNSLVICEITAQTNTTRSILNMGTLSNLPTGEAVFSVELKVTGATNGNISGLIVEM